MESALIAANKPSAPGANEVKWVYFFGKPFGRSASDLNKRTSFEWQRGTKAQDE